MKYKKLLITSLMITSLKIFGAANVYACFDPGTAQKFQSLLLMTSSIKDQSTLTAFIRKFVEFELTIGDPFSYLRYYTRLAVNPNDPEFTGAPTEKKKQILAIWKPVDPAELKAFEDDLLKLEEMVFHAKRGATFAELGEMK